MSSIKVYYFDFGGRAESIRLALVLGGVAFEDVRLAGPEFGQKKAEGFFKFGQMPVIEIDGKQYAQSHAIATWAATTAGIHPSDPLLQLQVNEAKLLVEDLLQKLVPTMQIKDEAARHEARAKYIETDLHNIATFAEKLLAANGTGFFVGDVIY